MNICWKDAPEDAKVIFMKICNIRPSGKAGSKSVQNRCHKIRNGEPIGLISIDRAGKIIEGNGKYYAVKQILKEFDSIPVIVDRKVILR